MTRRRDPHRRALAAAVPAPVTSSTGGAIDANLAADAHRAVREEEPIGTSGNWTLPGWWHQKYPDPAPSVMAAIHAARDELSDTAHGLPPGTSRERREWHAVHGARARHRARVAARSSSTGAEPR